MMYSSFPYNKPVPSYWVSKIPYIFHRITRAAKWPERPTEYKFYTVLLEWMYENFINMDNKWK